MRTCACVSLRIRVLDSGSRVCRSGCQMKVAGDQGAKKIMAATSRNSKRTSEALFISHPSRPMLLLSLLPASTNQEVGWEGSDLLNRVPIDLAKKMTRILCIVDPLPGFVLPCLSRVQAHLTSLQTNLRRRDPSGGTYAVLEEYGTPDPHSPRHLKVGDTRHLPVIHTLSPTTQPVTPSCCVSLLPVAQG